MEEEKTEIKTTEEIKEETSELDTGIGTKETVALKPGAVKIHSVAIEDVTIKPGEVVKKVVCLCKHPDKEEVVSISTVQYLVAKKVKTSGLWYKLDEDKQIIKNSALAVFLTHNKTETIRELNDKEVETILDDKDYLAFKAY